MRKKLLLIMMVTVLTIGLAGCGKTDDSVLSKKEVPQMLNNADDFKGRKVEDLPVKVFSIVNEEKGNYQYQAWSDADSNNSVLFTSTENLGLSEDDYVLISGTVSKKAKYETVMGVETSAPLIENVTAKKADASIFNPAESTIDVGETQAQNGVSVTLNKVDISKKSTRLYFTIKNETSDKIEIYTFNSFIKQGSTQYDESDISYEENTLKTEINAGITSEGLLSFEKIDAATSPFTVSIDVSSDNYDIEFNPFVFTVTP